MSFPTSPTWDNPETVATLTRLWLEGWSAADIAFELRVTRNAVIGKVHRLKKRDGMQRSRKPKTVNGGEAKRGRAGLPGQIARGACKSKIELRLADPVADRRADATAIVGLMDLENVTHLIRFSEREINRQCAYIPGDPRGGAKCCGRPVVEGTQWCAEHRARVYGAAQ